MDSWRDIISLSMEWKTSEYNEKQVGGFLDEMIESMLLMVGDDTAT